MAWIVARGRARARYTQIRYIILGMRAYDPLLDFVYDLAAQKSLLTNEELDIFFLYLTKFLHFVTKMLEIDRVSVVSDRHVSASNRKRT